MEIGISAYTQMYLFSGNIRFSNILTRISSNIGGKTAWTQVHAVMLYRKMWLSGAAGAALAAGGTTHHVQAGRTDLQDTTDVSAGVSEPPHHGTQQHAVTAIVISSTTGSSFQTNVFRQTFLQHCSAICLELSVSANICSELRLWHCLKPDLKLIFSLLLLANWLDLSASASEAIAPRVHNAIQIVYYYVLLLSLIHIWRCRRIERCRSRWSPDH